jgi:hypothetical protein
LLFNRPVAPACVETRDAVVLGGEHQQSPRHCGVGFEQTVLVGAGFDFGERTVGESPIAIPGLAEVG